MSDSTNSEALATDEKPAQENDSIKFPPLPDPTDDDFDEDVSKEERDVYLAKFPDITAIKKERLHCTACDRHLGCAPRSESRMRSHPMLRTLVCNSCHTFYNSGEFEKGDDGSELYCRWCGQGGQVYCCADCPHVFCAKCIKRNFGMPKIKEIENTDDWKCFKCKPECLWEIRAVCWALLRYCDLTNRFVFENKDLKLKEEYQKLCAVDDSECCKHKNIKKTVKPIKKDRDVPERKSKEPDSAKKVTTPIAKLPPTIQVKKFASINLEEAAKDITPVKIKPAKRPASPKFKPIIMRNPMSINIPQRLLNPNPGPMAKKIKISNPMPVRFQNTYARIRPKPPQLQMALMNNNFNGFGNPGMMHNNMVGNDNINLSLESLTQGLDMSSMPSMSSAIDNDVVCTPDFPLEPLCEVTEDNTDDDVQCITPSLSLPAMPPLASAPANLPPPLISRVRPSLNELTGDNVIQMTENDVTVNAATGGLKFRVDPQTLSSNKMYRLPDGRIFAINANPNMPGGYSATIVAVTETNNLKTTPKGSMYSAKLSSISSNQSPPPVTPVKESRASSRTTSSSSKTRKQNNQNSKQPKSKEKTPRKVDVNVPVEWFRYNLIDAVDSLQYSFARLQKMKKETTSMFLRTRSVAEIRNLHKSLERLLSTSCTRFIEIRNNLNKEMKEYLIKKASSRNNSDDDDDDDDVEILNDMNDDPIFIDENSLEATDANETANITTNEVDLTDCNESDQNNSNEKSMEIAENNSVDDESLIANENTSLRSDLIADSNLDNTEISNDKNDVPMDIDNDQSNKNHEQDLNKDACVTKDSGNDGDKEIPSDNDDQLVENENRLVDNEKRLVDNQNHLIENEDNLNENESIENTLVEDEDQSVESENPSNKNEKDNSKVSEDKNVLNEDKTQDAEMTEELIETLLKDDDDGSKPLNCEEISEEFQEP